jgi:hypothetical protein
MIYMRYYTNYWTRYMSHLKHDRVGRHDNRYAVAGLGQQTWALSPRYLHHNKPHLYQSVAQSVAGQGQQREGNFVLQQQQQVTRRIPQVTRHV